jgi:hypothetical protein
VRKIGKRLSQPFEGSASDFVEHQRQYYQCRKTEDYEIETDSELGTKR